MTTRMHCCLLLASLTLSAAPAFASGCGNKVASDGDSSMVLLRNSGEPTMKEQDVDRVPYRTLMMMSETTIAPSTAASRCRCGPRGFHMCRNP